jgi:caffeoyl-CoA O-methyltransferase
MKLSVKFIGAHMKFIDPSIENYAVRHSTIPSEVCNQIQEFTQENVELPQMLSGQLEGSILGFLIRMLDAKTIVEIGTYTGYCTLNLAEQSAEDAKIYTFDINQEYADIAQKYWGKSAAGKKITQYIGPALDNLEKISDDIDFVFIDADKTNYTNYLKAILPKLSKRGVIAIDNVLWSGKVLSTADDESTKAIQEVNDFVAADKNLYTTLLPIRDGIMLVQKY